MSSPANGATVSGSILVAASASDNVGVAGVQLKLDGANLGNAFTNPPYGGTLDTTTIANGSHTLTATAWDAAGNQASTAPVSVTVTNVTTPPLSLPVVSIAATVPTAVIGTTNYAAITFTRTGDTSSALTVNYTLGGTAVKWTDYRRPVTGDMPVSITIPAGASSYAMNIEGVANSTGANPETASFTLSADPAYTVGSPSTAIITIVSNTVAALPTVTVAATSPNASRVGPVNGALTITRLGDTSASLTVNYSLAGTATNGADYALLGTSVTIPAGAASTTITVVPKSAANYVGSETVALALAVNVGYTIGSAGNATVTIAGNSVPSTLSKVTGNNRQITWSSAPGKIYRVAYKNNLSDTTWTNLSGLITATGTTTLYTDTTANKSTQRYYLVYVTN